MGNIEEGELAKGSDRRATLVGTVLKETTPVQASLATGTHRVPGPRFPLLVPAS